MKKAIYFILCAVTLCACEKEFDIEKQMKDGMTYIKFVPSNDDDTTFFFVQATAALKNGMNPAKTVGETVSVTVNGTPLTLTKDSRKSTDNSSQIYWTKHVFKEGDEVVAEASVPGRKPVSASTVVPGRVLKFKWTAKVEAGPESYDKQLCIDLEYDNMPGFTGRYGVAVRYEQTVVKQPFTAYGDKPGYIEWGEPQTTVNIMDEYPSAAIDMELTSLGQVPLAFSPKRLNRDYSWSQYQETETYWPGFIRLSTRDRVLSWVDIPGKESRTSRWQVRVSYNGTPSDIGPSDPGDFWEWAEAGDSFYSYRTSYRYRYKLVFYSYDENCFNYLKARENEENGLALFGLAPVSFTFTNVRNGVGVCGSYMISETDWFTVNE